MMALPAFKIEPAQLIMENKLTFWLSNTIKYILRYAAKNGIEDPEKERCYLNIQIESI